MTLNNIKREEDDFAISFAVGETAIIIPREVSDTIYYILNGDHTEAYATGTLKECIEYFKKNIDQKSFWSNELLEEHT